MTTYYYNKDLGKVVEGRAPVRGEKPVIVKRKCADGGISFQFPEGWDDGSGKIKHVPSGPFKGRVYWSSKREAQEIAKRYSGNCNDRATYDPD